MSMNNLTLPKKAFVYSKTTAAAIPTTFNKDI